KAIDIRTATSSTTPTTAHPLHPAISGRTSYPTDSSSYSFYNPIFPSGVSTNPAVLPLSAALYSQPGPPPYHVPMSSFPVGTGIFLSGGFGYLSRMYGLSMDNVIEVEMVLADGKVVIVSKDSHTGT